jgi:hypothetical protein
MPCLVAESGVVEERCSGRARRDRNALDHVVSRVSRARWSAGLSPGTAVPPCHRPRPRSSHPNAPADTKCRTGRRRSPPPYRGRLVVRETGSSGHSRSSGRRPCGFRREPARRAGSAPARQDHRPSPRTPGSRLRDRSRPRPVSIGHSVRDRRGPSVPGRRVSRSDRLPDSPYRGRQARETCSRPT